MGSGFRFICSDEPSELQSVNDHFLVECFIAWFYLENIDTSSEVVKRELFSDIARTEIYFII